MISVCVLCIIDFLLLRSKNEDFYYSESNQVRAYYYKKKLEATLAEAELTLISLCEVPCARFPVTLCDVLRGFFGWVLNRGFSKQMSTPLPSCFT